MLSQLLLAALAAQDLAITNVQVIPMDRERVLRDQVVIVRDGRIASVGPPAQAQLPPGARVIDGKGGFLLPGLADMHVHINPRTDLIAYLASGVTTIANQGGSNSRLLRAWRDSIRARQLLGPELFVGYFVDGPGQRGGVATADDARNAVRAADSLGYDFVKVYNSLTREQFDAIIAEAKTRRIAVVGHGVRSVGLERAFAAGQSMVVHGEEFIYTELQHTIDDAKVPRVVEFTKQSGAFVVPNLSAYESMSLQWGKPEVLDQLLARPEARYMPKYWIDDWRERDYIFRRGSIADRNAFLKRLTLALQRGGVPLLTGTDSPGIPGMFAGYSLHEDLRLLVEAGLSPFEAITAATRNPGLFAKKHLGSEAPFGTIAAGSRADLILVTENPLDDVRRLRDPAAVMVRGRWLDRAELDRLRVVNPNH